MDDEIEQNGAWREGRREGLHRRLRQVATNQAIEQIEGEGARLVLHHLHVGTSRVAVSEGDWVGSRDARKRL